MTTQHTPGPWQPFTRYVTAKGRFLAKAFEANDATEQPGFSAGQEPQQSQTEAAANARLIAAAPELLAALEHLMRYDFGDSDGAKQARDAIAKAKGGAQ